MANTKIYGVELDTISAGIAQQLYQKSSIAAQGFEEVNVPDSFFDGVVGNVPFGDFKVLDKRYDKYNFLIHDYFFAKSLDKLRPGGVMALVPVMGQWIKQTRRSENISHREQTFWEQSGFQTIRLKIMPVRKLCRIYCSCKSGTGSLILSQIGYSFAQTMMVLR